MSTQQQIDAWNAAVVQKQQEKADQETILKVEQEQLAKAEDARINAELAVQRAQSSGASPEQVAELQRQVRLADSAESDARIAASKTQSNIQSLDGSIRYNTSQRDQFQAALPAQANPSSTVGDGPANVQSDAAEIAPAPTPAANSPDPVPRSAIEEGGDAEAQEALAVRNAEAAAADDPFETARLAREAEGDGPTLEAPEPVPPNLTQAWDPETGSYGVWDEDKGQFVETGLSEEDATRAAGDPFEAARLAREREFEEEQPAVFEPDPVPPTLSTIWDPETESYAIWADPPGEIQQSGFTTEDEARRAIDSQAPDISEEDLPPPPDDGLTDEERAEQAQADAEAAAKENAINQATRSSVYKKEGSSDWRVRLQLAPTSDYLYNVPVNPNDGTGPGILAPLADTNGVIFPYTPQINTSYRANYEQYDLVHSNYRGVYYKNSRVDDLSIRAVFTAQDTSEANYLLAVIHFFRSVTKMFYGKDERRGSPPPLVYLSGLGMNQFYGHPCVVSSFQYNLPDNVDYIRATSVNNYGTDLLSRRTATRSSGTAGLGATGNRILNAGLERFFPASKPAPDSVVGSVNNTQLANYVPTKMEIDITLIPVQTRSQVSKQFSLKGFANGELIKGGFW